MKRKPALYLSGRRGASRPPDHPWGTQEERGLECRTVAKSEGQSPGAGTGEQNAAWDYTAATGESHQNNCGFVVILSFLSLIPCPLSQLARLLAS